MDLHILNLHKEQWATAAAPTQFMWEGSSHELAALALMEALIHCTKNLKLPVVHVYLDKLSAFDTALKEHIIREIFTAAHHIPSQSILYMANRLSSRKTYLKVQSQVLGPINDIRGVEQGGISSSQQFQLITNHELTTLNCTGLGIPFGPDSIAAIGLADNQVLITTSTNRAHTLVDMAVDLGNQNNLTNIPSKTKLIITNPKASRRPVHAPIPSSSSITVDGVTMLSSAEATHLGVIRSSHHSSNSPVRFKAHTKSVFATLNIGLAKNHWTSHATSLKIHSVYLSPILFSGLATLVLTTSELSTLNTCQEDIKAVNEAS